MIKKRDLSVSAHAFEGERSLFTPHVLFKLSSIYPTIFAMVVYSGFPSTRINLSPFTKDFRGGEHN